MSDEPTISVAELLEILPDLIDQAIRARDNRAPDVQHALASIKTGTAVSVDDTTVEVQLDDDDPGTTVTVQAATVVAEGDRVVVLLRSGGGAYAIGNGGLQATGQLVEVGAVEILKCHLITPVGGPLTGAISWSHVFGDALFSLADPENPAAIQSGIYDFALLSGVTPGSIDPDAGTGSLGIPFLFWQFPDNPELPVIGASTLLSVFFAEIIALGGADLDLTFDALSAPTPAANLEYSFAAGSHWNVQYLSSVFSGDTLTDAENDIWMIVQRRGTA